MTKEFAREIADKFIKEHNPNLWDGLGNMPSNFSNKIEVYNIFSKEVYMTIQFEIDADEGGCGCEGLFYQLYENEYGNRIGYGVVDCDAIEDDINEYEAEVK